MIHRFRSVGLMAGFAGLLWTSPASAQSHSHGAHDHGSSSFDAGEPGDAARITRRVTIVAREANGGMSFEPSRVFVKKDETVEFTLRNEGLLEHEFVLGSAIENTAHAARMETTPDMKHDDPNATRIAPGKSARLVWRFTKAGGFEFACLIPGHYEAGMKGAAVVE